MARPVNEEAISPASLPTGDRNPEPPPRGVVLAVGLGALVLLAASGCGKKKPEGPSLNAAVVPGADFTIRVDIASARGQQHIGPKGPNSASCKTSKGSNQA